MKTFEELSKDFDAAEQDGLAAAFTELLRDEQFRQYVGCLATVYAVTARKVQSIDQRSFKCAKDKLATFLARTSGWSAKLSRDTRNGSWRRGSVHPASQEQGREDAGDLERLGRRGGRVRSLEQAAADSPAAVKQAQAPAVRDRCPSCKAKTYKVFAIPGRGVCCPACVRSKCAAINRER